MLLSNSNRNNKKGYILGIFFSIEEIPVNDYDLECKRLLIIDYYAVQMTLNSQVRQEYTVPFSTETLLVMTRPVHYSRGGRAESDFEQRR